MKLISRVVFDPLTFGICLQHVVSKADKTKL